MACLFICAKAKDNDDVIVIVCYVFQWLNTFAFRLILQSFLLFFALVVDVTKTMLIAKWNDEDPMQNEQLKSNHQRPSSKTGLNLQSAAPTTSPPFWS